MIDPTELRPGERFTARFRIGSAPESIEEDEAWATPTPGLIVNRSSGRPPGEWTVSHLRSGLGLGWFTDDPECAMAFAAVMHDVVDWTLSGTEVVASAGYSRRKIDAVATSMGLKRLVTYHPDDLFDVWP